MVILTMVHREMVTCAMMLVLTRVGTEDNWESSLDALEGLLAIVLMGLLVWIMF